MKFIKVISLCICLITLFCFSSKATHIIGGELSYKPLGNNNYEFTLKVYRDCSPATAQLDEIAEIEVYDTNGGFVNSIGAPITDSTFLPTNDPSNPCIVLPPNVCIEEGVYVFDLNLPPPATGYIVAYQRCCRNGAVMNINSPLTTGSTYFVTLTSNDLSLQNTSPVFKNYPPVALCVNTPFIIDNSAYDADGDSLTYQLSQPYSSPSGVPDQVPPPFDSVVYVGNYSYNHPMDASPALAVDTHTGMLSGTPTAIGRYVVGVSVNEYRHGVFLGTYLRDFQFIVVECHLSSKIAAAFTDSLSGLIAAFNSSLSIGAVSYNWDFGDGQTDTTANPVHTYNTSGKYEVCLHVTNADGCYSTQCQSIAPGESNPCKAFFVYYEDSVTAHHWYILNESSGKQPVNYAWSWGDGTTSAGPTPSHTYPAGGFYSICLSINDDTACTSIFCDSLAYYFRLEGGSPVTVDVIADFPKTPQTNAPASNPLSVSPNPCNTCFVNGIDNLNDISITDLLGRNVSATLTKTSPGVQINLAGDHTGFYIIRNLQTGQVVKFIREN